MTSIKKQLDQLFDEMLGGKDTLPDDLRRQMDDIEEALALTDFSSAPPLQVFAEWDAVLERAQEYVAPGRRKEYVGRIRSLCLDAAASLIARLARETILHESIPGPGTDLVRELKLRCERLTRRVELIAPSTEDQLTATLWWMREQGTRDDLPLLRQVRKLPPYTTPDIEDLFGEAERRIEERIAAKSWPTPSRVLEKPASLIDAPEGPRHLEDPAESKRTALQQREVDNRVRTVISQMLLPRARNRIELAAELAQLGVNERRSTQPRGSLEMAASNRLPQPDIDALIGLLQDPDAKVRSKVIFGLGEWGGGSAAEVVADLLRRDPDQNVRSYCIGALCLIGGPTAAKALQWAAAKAEAKNLRGQARAALAELEGGGALDLAEGF